MQVNEKYSQLASEDSIKKAIKNLTERGIRVFLVGDRKEALQKVLEFIPRHSEVMTMTSVTLGELGVDTLVDESDNLISVRKQLMKSNLERIEKLRIWSAHEWAVWSIQAITEEGQVLIASATGSQLWSYAYGAPNVLWIVWSQKIVKDLDSAMERIQEYCFPLENERSMKAYGMGSGVNKILLINQETTPGRIHIILVKEKLWY